MGGVIQYTKYKHELLFGISVVIKDIYIFFMGIIYIMNITFPPSDERDGVELQRTLFFLYKNV